MPAHSGVEGGRSTAMASQLLLVEIVKCTVEARGVSIRVCRHPDILAALPEIAPPEIGDAAGRQLVVDEHHRRSRAVVAMVHAGRGVRRRISCA